MTISADQARAAFVSLLARALELSRLHEPGSSLVQAAVNPLYEALARAVSPIIIEAWSDELVCGGRVVDTRAAESLRHHLRARSVSRIALPPSLGHQELWRLLVVSARSPEELARSGGLAEVLKVFEVEHVAIEMDEVTWPEELSIFPRSEVAPVDEIQHLLDVLMREPEREKRLALCRRITNFRQEAVPHLVRASGPWFFLRNVLRILADIRDPAGIDKAVSLLAHSNPRIRVEAIRALGLMGGPVAMRVLVAITGFNGKRVQRESFPGMSLAAEARLTYSLEAVRALGELPGHQVVEILEALASKPRAGGDAGDQVRAAAVEALTTHSSSFAWRALMRISRSKYSSAVLAKKALDTHQSSKWHTSGSV